MAWGEELLRPLVSRFGEERYSPLSIEGSCQAAAEMEGALPGTPIMHEGSPCHLMLGCEHPAPGSKASFYVGEAFWKLYFFERVRDHHKGSLMPSDFPPVEGWKDQWDDEVQDVLCNLEWVPNLRDPNATGPPCNRQTPDYEPIVVHGPLPED